MKSDSIHYFLSPRLLLYILFIIILHTFYLLKHFIHHSILFTIILFIIGSYAALFYLLLFHPLSHLTIILFIITSYYDFIHRHISFIIHFSFRSIWESYWTSCHFGKIRLAKYLLCRADLLKSCRELYL